jgi:hypothetical protein
VKRRPIWKGKLGDLDDGLMSGCWGIGRAILECER